MQTSASIMSEIRQTVLSLKNPLVPLDAVEQLSMATSALCDYLATGDFGEPSLSALCDALIASSQIGNIYRLPLAAVDSDGGVQSGYDSILGPAVIQSSLDAIKRRVEVYEGRSPSVHRDRLPALADLLCMFESRLLELATRLGPGLCDVLCSRLNRAIDTDERQIYIYHPSNAKALRSFATIQQHTACPFAKLATVWGAPPWNHDLDVEENARNIAPALRLFSNLQRWHVLDGFVVEIDQKSQFRTLSTLCTTFRGLLVSLNVLDDSSPNLFCDQVRSADWQFCFCNVRMFVTVFSPLYGPDSPRETYGHPSTFVFFQPGASFLEHKALRDDDLGSDRNRLSRIFNERFANIRKRFADVGKPYDCEIMRKPYQAPRYLKPLRLGDCEVKWWSE